MSQSPRNSYETDPDKIDWLLAYQDKEYLNHLAASLFVFGAERFKAAKIIEGLSHLEATFRQYKTGVITFQTAIGSVLPFMWDWLIDEIRICLFFENFMKGELIYQGFVVQQFRNNTEEKGSRIHQLIKEQQKRPVLASALTEHQVRVRELHKKTISMDLMLRPSYQEVIRLPTEVLTIVKRLNENRNKLHFASEAAGQLSESLINDLKLIDAFVDFQRTRLVSPES